MKLKGIIIMTFLLLAVLAIASVSAADNATVETFANDNQTDDGGLKTDEIAEILDTSPKTFTDLNTAINGNNDSDIYLHENYTYKSGYEGSFKDGITISRAVTIHGNGITINGSNDARIFTVTADNVIFRDIIFVNGYASSYDTHGGAINGECTAINCTFDYNRASGNGGAMYRGSAVNCTFTTNIAQYGGAIYRGSAVDCTFIFNFAWQQGGAIYYMAVENCTFKSNSAKKQGGAICGGSALNCNFTGNHVENAGGAMYESSALNCIFKDNYAGSYGGAMYKCNATHCSFNNNSAGADGGAVGGVFSWARNCNFTENHAYRGGAMDSDLARNCIFDGNYAYFGGALYYTSAVNCTFKNNIASDDGGAIKGYEQNATNCRFINNTAKNGGATCGIPARNCIFTENTASECGGAMYEGIARNCIFQKNRANLTGDDTYNTNITNPVLTVRDLTTSYGSGDKVLFNFTDVDGTPITTAEITLRLYSGTALIGTYHASSGEGWTVNTDAGTYTAVCSVENQAYNVEAANATVTIRKADSALSVTDITFKYNTIGYASASFSGAEGITAEVTGHKEAVVAVEGNTISVSNLNPGTYTLSVMTITDANHNPVSRTSTITVNDPSKRDNPASPSNPASPAKTVLTLKKVTVKRSAKKLVISATLKINGKAAKGKTITFKFSNKKYSAKTNAKGIAKITVKKSVLKKLKAGKKVKYQASYGATTVKKTVKVKK